MDENDISVVNPDSSNQQSDLKRLKSSLVASYSGPIPSALEFREYERTLAGAAHRIITMAENESLHRQKIESALVDNNIKLAHKEALERIIGMIFGFLIVMSCIISGAILVLKGKPISGTIFSGVGLASIAAVFYSNRVIRYFSRGRD